MNTTIIIPTYNEAENIVSLIQAILNLEVADLSVIVVDDNSPDGTAQLVSDQFDDSFVRVLKRNKKAGIGSAYICGFEAALAAGEDYIFEMDADWSHDPLDIPKLITAAEVGAGLAIGSRRVDGGGIEGWNMRRKMMSYGAMQFARVVLGLKTRDVTSGFRCYTANTLRKIDLASVASNGYAFQEEMLYRVEQQGSKVTEVPIVFKDRTKGVSKLSVSDIVEFFIVMLKLRFQKN